MMLTEKEVTMHIPRAELGICEACLSGPITEEICLKDDGSVESTGVFCCNHCNSTLSGFLSQKTNQKDIPRGVIAKLIMQKHIPPQTNKTGTTLY